MLGTLSSLTVNFGTDLSIVGMGPAETTINAGGDSASGLQQSVFTVVGILNLDGLTISGGDATSTDNAFGGEVGEGGAILTAGAGVNLVNTCLEDNTAAYAGGAIFGFSVNMSGCTVCDNTTSEVGGGIDIFRTANISGCTFYGNSVTGVPSASTNDNTGTSGQSVEGGAVYARTATISDSTFTGNVATGGAGGDGAMLGGDGGDSWGGAIFCSRESTLINDTIVNNSAVGGDGGSTNRWRHGFQWRSRLRLWGWRLLQLWQYCHRQLHHRQQWGGRRRPRRF